MSEHNKDMHKGRDWYLYIDDMILFAEKALLYTEGLDRHQFEESGLN